MKLRQLLALVLLGACADPMTEQGGGGGGKGDDPEVGFTDVVTQWEFTVGHAGDAVVDDVTVLPGGSMFVTSSFPRWLRKITADGARDTTWGSEDPVTRKRSGYLDAPAHEIWHVGGNKTIVSYGDGALYQLRGYLADGTLNPDFGDGGVVALPYEDGKPLRVAYDEQTERVLVVVAREWQVGGSFNQGPSKIELLAYDQATGAKSSLGIHMLPPWTNTGTNPARIREIILQPDGSHGLLASETIDPPGPVLEAVATQWSHIRIEANEPPQFTPLLVTDYDPHVAGFTRLGGGHFDLYLSAVVEGLSTKYNDTRLVRISVDDAAVAQVADLDSTIDFTKGCPASIATPTHLVVGQSIDRSQPIQFTAFPKSSDGTPISFTSDKPKRCLTSLDVAPNGRIYAGTWDTTNTGWTALLTSFAPE